MKISQEHFTHVHVSKQIKPFSTRKVTLLKDWKTIQEQIDDLTERVTASEQKVWVLDTQLAAINIEKELL